MLVVYQYFRYDLTLRETSTNNRTFFSFAITQKVRNIYVCLSVFIRKKDAVKIMLLFGPTKNNCPKTRTFFYRKNDLFYERNVSFYERKIYIFTEKYS